MLTCHCQNLSEMIVAVAPKTWNGFVKDEEQRQLRFCTYYSDSSSDDDSVAPKRLQVVMC